MPSGVVTTLRLSCQPCSHTLACLCIQLVIITKDSWLVWNIIFSWDIDIITMCNLVQQFFTFFCMFCSGFSKKSISQASFRQVVSWRNLWFFPPSLASGCCCHYSSQGVTYTLYWEKCAYSMFVVYREQCASSIIGQVCL